MNLVLKDEYDSQFDPPKILTRLMAVILMFELMVSIPLLVSHGRRIRHVIM